MLESNRFAIRPWGRGWPAARAFELCDADTGRVLGTVREVVGGVLQALRRLVGGRSPLRLEVREGPDESLVFVVRWRAGPLRPRFDVLDGQDQFVGAVRGDPRGGGVRVLDQYGRTLAQVEGDPAAGGYRFVSAVGGWFPGRVDPADGGWALTVAPELADDPFGKMLLLAAVLAIGLGNGVGPGGRRRG